MSAEMPEAPLPPPEVGSERFVEPTVSSEPLNNNPNFIDGVMGIDPATIGIAFQKLTYHSDTHHETIVPSDGATKLVSFLERHPESDFEIHDAVADAGGESKRQAMNDLAKSHGFGTPFPERFDPDDIAVLAIVDKKMKWYDRIAKKARLIVPGDDGGDKTVDAVEFKPNLPQDNIIDVFSVNGIDKPVVRIAADPEQSGGVQNYMWVTELLPDDNPGLVELFAKVSDVVGIVTNPDTPSPRRGASEVKSIKMPKLPKVTYTHDWSNEIGGTMIGSNKVITKAIQEMRVSVDDRGAEAAARTSMFATRGRVNKDNRETIILGDNGPLLVWFTEGDSRLPICAMLTNQKAWPEYNPDLDNTEDLFGL